MAGKHYFLCWEDQQQMNGSFSQSPCPIAGNVDELKEKCTHHSGIFKLKVVQQKIIHKKANDWFNLSVVFWFSSAVVPVTSYQFPSLGHGELPGFHHLVSGALKQFRSKNGHCLRPKCSLSWASDSFCLTSWMSFSFRIVVCFFVLNQLSWCLSMQVFFNLAEAHFFRMLVLKYMFSRRSFFCSTRSPKNSVKQCPDIGAIGLVAFCTRCFEWQ